MRTGPLRKSRSIFRLGRFRLRAVLRLGLPPATLRFGFLPEDAPLRPEVLRDAVLRDAVLRFAGRELFALFCGLLLRCSLFVILTPRFNFFCHWLNNCVLSTLPLAFKGRDSIAVSLFGII